jgi:hypothetical protein
MIEWLGGSIQPDGGGGLANRTGIVARRGPEGSVEQSRGPIQGSHRRRARAGQRPRRSIRASSQAIPTSAPRSDRAVGCWRSRCGRCPHLWGGSSHAVSTARRSERQPPSVMFSRAPRRRRRLGLHWSRVADAVKWNEVRVNRLIRGGAQKQAGKCGL